jgi:hypothetical protein
MSNILGAGTEESDSTLAANRSSFSSEVQGIQTVGLDFGVIVLIVVPGLIFDRCECAIV